MNFEKFLRTPLLAASKEPVPASKKQKNCFTEHIWATPSGSLTMIKDGRISVGKETISL